MRYETSSAATCTMLITAAEASRYGYQKIQRTEISDLI